MARTLVVLVLLLLAPLAAGCTMEHQAGPAGQRTPPASGSCRDRMRALASAYLAIAQPANRRLDVEVDG